MTADEAVARFRRAAIEKGDFAVPAHRDHALHEEMADAWRCLDAEGEVGLASFRSLLTDPSEHVRCWVASQLLGTGDASGIAVLEASAAGEGLRAFASRMVLQEWRAGRLRSPFGAPGRSTARGG